MSEFVSSVNFYNLRVESALRENHVSFSNIVQTRPYLMDKKVTTIADLDGVFLEYGNNNTYEKNIERLRSLVEIAKNSEEIVLWSGRTVSKRCDFLPFISEEKVNRLSDLIIRSNPDCKVTINCGVKKFINGSDISEKIKEKMNLDKNVVVIGSSIFDKRAIKKASSEIGLKRQNLFYFNTGHWII